MYAVKAIIILVLFLFSQNIESKNTSKLSKDVELTMLKATKFMVNKVSNNGGYVWYYELDFNRCWGELEATKTMIWLQDPGTTLVGHVLLDAYKATGNEYYYSVAAKTANAIIRGQSTDGGWNYMIDLAGEKSLKQWYNTIGKNAWRLEEFQHYYGNSTFDDNVTSDAARFLLRMYLTKLDSVYKPALEKAISFILKSQYPIGAWPQRYPKLHEFSKNGNPDYSVFYTYNDDVIWENIHFLMQCYITLGESRFIEPIKRAMNFYLISQDSKGGWGQQMDFNLKTAGARTYEPKALLPKNTASIIRQLMDFYRFTADRKYLDPIPDALKWLKQNKLADSINNQGKYSHPQFIDIVTNKALYVHRKGSNVVNGLYYVDYCSEKLLGHYSGKTFVDIQSIEYEYINLLQQSVSKIREQSPLYLNKKLSQDYYDISHNRPTNILDEQFIKTLLQSIDNQGRWLIKHGMTSNRYIGNGVKTNPTVDYSNTFVGDETDTSPFRDKSEKLYISTGEFIRNMRMLINYVEATKNGLTEEQLKARQR